MSHLPKILNALSKLLSYPDDNTVQTAELLYVLLMDELPEAASAASTFGSFVEQHELDEVEEAFTRVFDVNPTCALEVGWHLFGEEYARGMFLVRMREELRKYDLPESVELTDHLCHVLAIVAAMPEDEAARFVKACVQPAVAKMNQALQDKETPYRPVMQCLALVLAYTWGEVAEPEEDASQEGVDRLHRFKSDPLQSYPAADVGGGEPMQLVSLGTSLLAADERKGGGDE
jgi:nitrate reductase molybdenum cofactor assembly chaperone NarJ/NarW